MSRNDKTKNELPAVVGVGLVDKQTGGPGHYARVEVTLRPLAEIDRGGSSSQTLPNTVTNAVVGGAIPGEFLPSVIDGIQEALQQGPLGGYPVTGVAVTITDGKAHSTDSNTYAFKEAGRLAVRDALSKADAALLEPVAKLTVTTPTEFVGSVIGDINRRRGQILDSTGGDGGSQTIEARVALSEMFGYATHLRSLTQGRADFVLEPDGYAEASTAVTRTVTEQRG